MTYWIKWEWYNQCEFCKRRKYCKNRKSFQTAIKQIKDNFDKNPIFEKSTLTIECDSFSVDLSKYEEWKN